ncbi:hypothetical protein LR004_01655 [Candidatus Gracilibacteria bacterium]|nr:hypothetical protein [Candidatus Gracilibacteria bacterium]
MDFSDLIIIGICIVSAGLFSFLGTDRLYRFYFGLIMGFLLFLVFNLQIKLVQLGGGIDISGWQHFLVSKKDGILSFFSFMIPIFGFLFAFIDSEIKSNKVFSILFGSLLPAFLLGILGYTLSTSSVELGMLDSMLSIFKDSKIFDILQKAPKLIFGLLLIIIFWKYIFAIIISFLSYLARLITSEVNDLRGIEEREEKEEVKRVKLN